MEREETSLSIHPLLLSWLAPCLLAKERIMGWQISRGYGSFRRDLAMAPRSLRLWSDSQMVTPGPPSTKPHWLHFTWGRITTSGCARGLGVIPPL